MKKALVEPSGRVAQVEPVPAGGGDPFPIAQPLVWRDCPDDTTTQHRWNGTSFDAPPPPPAPARGLVNAKLDRAGRIEELEQRMSRGAPQGEVNQAILDLLRE